MTKRDMIIEIHRAMQEKQPDNAVTTVERMLGAFCNVAAAELLGGGEIPLPGMGKLKVKQRAARKARNPRTGEAIDIPAGKKIVFAPFKDSKAALNGEH